MRRSLPIAISVAVLAAVAAIVCFAMYSKSQGSLAAARDAEVQVQDQYAEAIQEIAEIQDSLSVIVPEGPALPGASSEFTRERGLGGPNSSEIFEHIASLRAGLERGKVRIRRLESDLQAAGLRVDGLQKLLGGLRREVREKEERIAGMASELALVRDTLRIHDEVLADRQRQLATVYYVAGSRRELLRAGVIEAHGGVLGLGRSLRPSGRAPEELFSLLDTDAETVLALHAPRARVVSAQPVASYELRQSEGGLELHILDPEQFRKVRQLVIVTA